MRGDPKEAPVSEFSYQSMVALERIHRILLTEFDREASTGFARLSRVPDTLVRRFLDYYRSLDTVQQAALADASVLWGTHTLAGSVIGGQTFDEFDVGPALRSNTAWANWLHDMTHGNNRDPYWYSSVPMLRLYRAAATTRRKTGEPPPTEWDRMMDEYASSVSGAKAPALRALVRDLFKQRFRGRSAKGSGGAWMYEGEVRHSRVLMSVDWGGHYAQLRYGLTLETTTGTLRLSRGFEGALGAGQGNWDFLTEENAAESIALLGDLIEDVAQWPARLAT